MDPVELSIKAKQLLDEKVMDTIFDLLREDLKDELVATRPDQGQRREELYMMLQGLDRLEFKFMWACTQQDFEDFQERNLEANVRRV